MAKINGVNIVDHPLVLHKLAILRDKTTSTKNFRQISREIATLLCYEVTRDLEMETARVETPMGSLDAPKIAGKKPLTGETRALATTINYQLQGDNAVSIGSPMVYAAMQQFGGKKSDFPHLWGNIPARPFLGASEADKTNIAELVRSYMRGE